MITADQSLTDVRLTNSIGNMTTSTQARFGFSNSYAELNKQLSMYRAFGDMDGMAAVTRELQIDAYACPVKL